MNKTQLRGNCQLCGRDQAVARGNMAKHGYTVGDGYFQGVCSGHHHAPMQLERTFTDSVIKSVRADVIRLRKLVVELQTGKTFPSTVRVSGYKRLANGVWGYEVAEFATGGLYQQKDAIKHAIYTTSSRADGGEKFCEQMTELVDSMHGKPLTVVTLEEGPAKIEAGEQRQGNKLMTAVMQDGANVYYTYENSQGVKYKAKIGVRAWRLLPLVTEKIAITA